MPTFNVEVAAKDAESTFPLPVEARTPNEARHMAAQMGYVVGPAHQVPEPLPKVIIPSKSARPNHAPQLDSESTWPPWVSIADKITFGLVEAIGVLALISVAVGGGVTIIIAVQETHASSGMVSGMFEYTGWALGVWLTTRLIMLFAIMAIDIREIRNKMDK